MAQRLFYYSDQPSAQYFEILLRSLLIRQDNPAVVLLGHFAPQMQEQHGYGGPESQHISIAQFYDVPHIRCSWLVLHASTAVLTSYILA